MTSNRSSVVNNVYNTSYPIVYGIGKSPLVVLLNLSVVIEQDD